ncbi:MAG: hypothetical protein DRH08_09810 [Deltaproteobacteria bacterium]|nr:MAG: hypothetical protein DRH08_09810 [Deltaproteobacteria bacterium]
MFENTYLTVKTDKYKEFSEAMLKHNEKYHTTGPYHANVWMVSTGYHPGSIVWSMGPCSFSHLDSRPTSKDHNEDWTENVMPNVERVIETGYWRRSDKISYMPDDSLFSKLLITVYDLAQWQEYRFKDIMGKVSEVYKANNTPHSFSVYFPAFDMPNGRDVAVVWGFKEYAVFDDDWKFKSQYEEAHGEGSWQKVMDEYRAIVKSSVDEIWEIMPGMMAPMKD